MLTMRTRQTEGICHNLANLDHRHNQHHHVHHNHCLESNKGVLQIYKKSLSLCRADPGCDHLSYFLQRNAHFGALHSIKM